jgi:hypothetical protein
VKNSGGRANRQLLEQRNAFFIEKPTLARRFARRYWIVLSASRRRIRAKTQSYQ